MNTQAQAGRGKQLIELAEKYSANNYHPLDVALEKSEGVWVWDADGKKYLDCLSAYSAVNQGHCHPAIIKAMTEQASRITLTSRAFHNTEMGPFLKELCEFCEMEMALPMNTGAEAVETAIKTARKWGYKIKGVADGAAEIIVCDGNFHGRTTTIVGFSSEDQYKDGFGPFTPGFKLIPYGDIEALKAAITPNTVGFMVEPIQGEAGVVVPPAGFLKEARALCTEENVLFIADEVQTGFGRTGTRFCLDRDGITADILIMGKALGGGVYPVSAITASKEILSVYNPGDHGSTFGGNPLGAAVARAALKVIQDEELVRKSDELGEYFMGKLREIDAPCIKEVRGRGLLIGLEIHESSGPARPYCEKLRDEGILAKETHGQVIRFAPPLVISKEDLDWMIEKVTKILKG
jgi:ornithine--oxo-acid transaminase